MNAARRVKLEQLSASRSDAFHGRVVAIAVARAAEAVGLRNATLARVLGVSEATISRLKAGSFLLDPNSKPYELAVLFVRLFRGLDAVVGGDASSARSWMTTENIALWGKPIELIASIAGLVAAVSYVDARRARI